MTSPEQPVQLQQVHHSNQQPAVAHETGTSSKRSPGTQKDMILDVGSKSWNFQSLSSDEETESDNDEENDHVVYSPRKICAVQIDPVLISNSHQDAKNSEISAISSSDSSLEVQSAAVRVEVGDKTFLTTRATLDSESPYFAAVLADLPPRGAMLSYTPAHLFIDADAELFPYILRYLRHGVLPMKYDKTNGFDYNFYIELLEEARFFGIKRLVEWLEQAEYEKCVTATWIVEDLNSQALNDLQNVKISATTDRWFFPSHATKTTRTYLCPREIPSHKGDPDMCGKQCRAARGDGPFRYEHKTVESLRATVVSRTVNINREGFLVRKDGPPE